ncbi:thiosulfate/3-mercaptopyruvate sulfurtransferase [Pseudarthrobacter defluvii]|uniref:sulfurtransferase n=1 Tax=Pseudarthrobacter defluvii TaxID=410837 RepID=UPI00277F0921|nr:sulfurtransferase [Pseudarthrobacter defluvii]MDQ0768632.1 thiosulfate/3-mercaptopyruvate sulfurtransferase [Pseudarthrobacter defluvii]
MKPLIDVPELEARLAAGQRTVLLDVRWVLGDPHGHEHYLSEHLPGAAFVDLATELSDPAVPDRGRHPLPSPEQFQESARRWGIRNGDLVVAYDDSANMAAARLWWMLRDAGLAEVYLLDGGLAAWRAAGLPLESGPVQPTFGDVELGSGHMPVADAGAAARWAGSGLLLDARAGERYRGEVEPVDPRAGHIPGAVSAPTAGNVDAAGRFLPPAELKRRFEHLGIRVGTPVAVYCGSGVTAAHEVAALELAGFRAALYPGSFSEWSNRPELPVATGPEPAGGIPDSGRGGTRAGNSAGAGGSVAL